MYELKLSGENREALARALQGTLTDLVALGLAVKQAHWNVVGPAFKPVHEHLDQLRDQLDEFVDEIAERMVALSISPNGQVSDVASITRDDLLPRGWIQDSDVVRLIASALYNTNLHVRELMASVEEIDTVTADLMHEVVAGLEKALWMFRAQVR